MWPRVLESPAQPGGGRPRCFAVVEFLPAPDQLQLAEACYPLCAYLCERCLLVQLPEFAYLLILPWNLRDEIMEQMAGLREWGCRFVVAIPEVTVV